MAKESESKSGEALLWLAGLEKDCDAGHPLTDNYFRELGECCGCNGSNKIPVLDMREPCPNEAAVTLQDSHNQREHVYQHKEWLVCTACKGRTWVPKQGREALHDAMLKAGWDYDIVQRVRPGYLSEGRTRLVLFSRPAADFGHTGIINKGIDADDWLAAVKAMNASGVLLATKMPRGSQRPMAYKADA